jgi:hypothetical protein
MDERASDRTDERTIARKAKGNGRTRAKRNPVSQTQMGNARIIAPTDRVTESAEEMDDDDAP